jgi:guanylate kinase
MEADRKEAAERLQEQRWVVIFAGPHAAGKDTIEAAFNFNCSRASRIVRHSSRLPHTGEQDGIDYHFVTHDEMRAMAERGDFVEYAEYPGVITGTSFQAIEEALRDTQFATTTLNFEDGLVLGQRLSVLGVANQCLFVGPCSEEVMLTNPEEYLRILRERMTKRGRATDDIDGRLIMAMEYRELYLQYRGQIPFIDNSDGQAERAVEQLNQLLERPGYIE